MGISIRGIVHLGQPPSASGGAKMEKEAQMSEVPGGRAEPKSAGFRLMHVL
jgi:hypothetical protein